MKLGKEKQISYRSTPDIVARLDLAASRLAVSMSFDGGKLRTGHLVNAVALWLSTLDDAELVQFARPKMKALERCLASVGPGDKLAQGDGTGIAVHDVSRKDVPTVMPSPRPARRKR
jgi:hypothetical protein